MLKGPEKLEENHTSLVWCIVLKKKIWKINEKNYKTTKRTHTQAHTFFHSASPPTLLNFLGRQKNTWRGPRKFHLFSHRLALLLQPVPATARARKQGRQSLINPPSLLRLFPFLPGKDGHGGRRNWLPTPFSLSPPPPPGSEGGGTTGPPCSTFSGSAESRRRVRPSARPPVRPPLPSPPPVSAKSCIPSIYLACLRRLLGSPFSSLRARRGANTTGLPRTYKEEREREREVSLFAPRAPFPRILSAGKKVSRSRAMKYGKRMCLLEVCRGSPACELAC